MKSVRKSFNLEALIGSVSQKYEQDLRNDSSFNLKNQDIEAYEIQGLKIPAKLNKVQESFKIKKQLKSIVEEIVKEAKKLQFNISKGQIYNHLIELGLKKLRKN